MAHPQVELVRLQSTTEMEIEMRTKVKMVWIALKAMDLRQ